MKALNDLKNQYSFADHVAWLSARVAIGLGILIFLVYIIIDLDRLYRYFCTRRTFTRWRRKPLKPVEILVDTERKTPFDPYNVIDMTDELLFYRRMLHNS